MVGLFKRRDEKSYSEAELVALRLKIKEVRAAVESMYGGGVLRLDSLRETRRLVVENIIQRTESLDERELTGSLNLPLIHMLVNAFVFDKLIKSRIKSNQNIKSNQKEYAAEASYSLKDRIHSGINRAEGLAYKSKRIIFTEVLMSFDKHPFEPENVRADSPKSVTDDLGMRPGKSS